MDAFEQLVADLLWREGYWVTTSFKVELTKEEKRRIGRATTPRWEIDILAYSPPSNEILALECKSYLDSVGVRMVAFDGSSPKHAKRFKLFNEPQTRKVVLRRLAKQVLEERRCAERPKVRLGLVAGRFATEADQEAVSAHFTRNNWMLLGPEWIRERLEAIAGSGYENQVIAVVAKILLRNR
jgi:DNA-binding transcriptional ArsR family regulator